MPRIAVRNSRWCVYIVRCADGTLYTGTTTDPARRVDEHNAGTASRYTRSRLPVLLVYRRRVANRGAALVREAAIKKLSREEKEALIAAAASRIKTARPSAPPRAGRRSAPPR